MHAEVLEVARNGAAVKKEIQVHFDCMSRLEYRDSCRGMFYYCEFATFYNRFSSKETTHGDLSFLHVRETCQLRNKKMRSCLFTQHNADFMSSSGHITWYHHKWHHKCSSRNCFTTFCTEIAHWYPVCTVYQLKHYRQPVATSHPLKILWMTAPTF